jgi:hypothetical protein
LIIIFFDSDPNPLNIKTVQINDHTDLILGVFEKPDSQRWSKEFKEDLCRLEPRALFEDGHLIIPLDQYNIDYWSKEGCHVRARWIEFVKQKEE